MHDDLFQIENKFKGGFEFNSLKLPTHISYNLKKSFYLLSWKSLSCIKFQNWKIFSNEIQIFFNTPCHLNKWKKSCHLLSRVLWWKEFEFTKIIKAKMKVWESPFIPSHLTFKKFRIHSLSDNQSNNQSNLSIYYNIPKFRILGCYKPTTLKMNLVLEIRRG